MKRYPTDAYVGDYEKTNVQKLRANQKMCKNKKSFIDEETNIEKRNRQRLISILLIFRTFLLQDEYLFMDNYNNRH